MSYLLFIIAIIAFSVMNQNKKAEPAEVSRPKKRKAVLASFEEEEEEREDEMPFSRSTRQAVPQEEKLMVSQSRNKAKRVKHAQAAETKRPQQSQPAEKKQAAVSLRTAADARRAFIYSEIWNRKYE